MELRIVASRVVRRRPTLGAVAAALASVTAASAFGGSNAAIAAPKLTAISASSGHACMVTAGGGVKCWGSNEYGELGNGSKKRGSAKPVNVLFSAKRTTKPSTPSSGDSKRCSEAEARRMVKQLRLGDPSVADPFGKVLCGAFTGPGSQAMVVVLRGPGNTGFVDWVVFRWAGGAWQFLMKQPLGGSITAAGSAIRQTLPIYRSSDSRCCPTGGTKTRIWRWNGSRLVAGPWKQVTKGESESRGFYSGEWVDVRTSVRVVVRTGLSFERSG